MGISRNKLSDERRHAVSTDEALTPGKNQRTAVCQWHLSCLGRIHHTVIRHRWEVSCYLLTPMASATPLTPQNTRFAPQNTKEFCYRLDSPVLSIYVSCRRFPRLSPPEMSSLAAPYFAARVPRSADVLLYLDLDGVAHHEAVFWHPRKGPFMSPELATGRSLFEWVPELEEALAPFPDVGLVLSSTWCIRPGFSKTLKYFSPALRSKFVGGTFHKRSHGADPWVLESFRSTPRGLQVWADVQRRKPKHWLALDDDAAGWPTFALENLVACNGSTGLSCARVQMELRQKLSKFQEALAGGAGNAAAY
jgi:hypothetical protein